ncbi:MAG: hypothetical protein ACUVWJ_05980 [Spirochaetota bacterium]
MIRKFFLMVAVLVGFLLLGFWVSSAAESSFGIGIMAGSPTGISAKYYISKAMAVDAGLGWSLSKDVLRLHGDFLFHNYKLLPKALDFPLVLYFGGGVKTVFAKDFELGARIPVGALYNFEKPKIDVFFELVPVINFIPDTSFDFDGAIGARFYFSIK